MMRCRRCNFENTDTDAYCAQCGSLLSSSTSYQTSQAVYSSIAPPPPPIEYGISPQPPAVYNSIPPPPPAEYGISPQMFAYEKIPPTRTDGAMSLIIRSILYFIGTAIAAFGLVGGLLSFVNNSLSVAFGVCLLVVGVIAYIIVVMRHRIPLLRWWRRVLLLFGATFGAVIAMIVQYATIGISSTGLPSAIFGSIILLYGLAIAVIALR